MEETLKIYDADTFFFTACPFCGVPYCIHTACVSGFLPFSYRQPSRNDMVTVSCPICAKQSKLLVGKAQIVKLTRSNEELLSNEDEKIDWVQIRKFVLERNNVEITENPCVLKCKKCGSTWKLAYPLTEKAFVAPKGFWLCPEGCNKEKKE